MREGGENKSLYRQSCTYGKCLLSKSLRIIDIIPCMFRFADVRLLAGIMTLKLVNGLSTSYFFCFVSYKLNVNLCPIVVYGCPVAGLPTIISTGGAVTSYGNIGDITESTHGSCGAIAAGGTVRSQSGGAVANF